MQFTSVYTSKSAARGALIVNASEGEEFIGELVATVVDPSVLGTSSQDEIFDICGDMDGCFSIWWRIAGCTMPMVYIETVHVDKNHRGMKLGHALIEQAMIGLPRPLFACLIASPIWTLASRRNRSLPAEDQERALTKHWQDAGFHSREGSRIMHRIFPHEAARRIPED